LFFIIFSIFYSSPITAVLYLQKSQSSPGLDGKDLSNRDCEAALNDLGNSIQTS
jgi:hypothetical protein